MSAISFKHLTKHYGSLVALNDVSLEIEEGEFFGLLGPNG
ncbi:MAG: ABC transporter ATP-binding protein, partial [Polynucleobacter victoriensis]